MTNESTTPAQFTPDQPYAAPAAAGAVQLRPQPVEMQQWGPSAGAPLGTVRSTGLCILLTVVTLGIYGIYWNCIVHREMKRHTGHGFGGFAALVLSCIPFVMTFLTPSEVGKLYVQQNRQAPVSAATGFWTLVPVAGPFIWFAKINGALNEYWTAMGAGQRV